jgi:hypothetical protein
MFEAVEKLKQQYTDQFVVVEGNRPELARFDGYTGQVKTVNMSGRALVQFDAWNNIAWYDIDTSYLRIVPKPEPGAEGKKAEAAHKPAPKAAVNKKEDVIGEKPAGGAPGAKPGGKMSTADILAAARAKAAAAPAASPAAKSAAKPAAAKPAAAPAKATAPAPGKKMSTADILAMARANKGAPAAEAPQPVAEAATEEPVETAPAPSAPAAAGEGARYSGPIPTTTAERIALCRQLDAK